MNFDINIISDGARNRGAVLEEADTEDENEVNDKKMEEKSEKVKA